MDQGHDDIAGGGGVGALDDHEVAVEDAGVDHRVAGDLEHEVFARAQDAFRHRHPVAFLLDGLDGRAGGDLAEDRQIAAVIRRGWLGGTAVHQLRLERRAALGRGRRGCLLRKFDHLQRPGAVGQAAQEAAFFQGGYQPVDAGLGRQVQGLLHLIEGRRNSALLDPLMDEHQQFVLLAGQHGKPRGTKR